MPGPLRVLVITEADPLYVIRFFEVFLAELPREQVTLVGLTVDRAFHEPLWKTARRMWRFYGPAGFVRMGTRFALARARGRSITALAEQAGVPVIPAASVNDPDYLARVRALAPDVIVSVAAPEIFKPPLLALAPRGAINIHSGRLPVYRGMMPTFWQMLNGERAVTVTVHEMAEKLDAGRVLATRTFPVRDQDTLDRVITETKREGARLMIDVLEQIRTGRTEPQTLDMTQARYFSFPQREHVREFRRRGHRLL